MICAIYWSSQWWIDGANSGWSRLPFIQNTFSATMQIDTIRWKKKFVEISNKSRENRWPRTQKPWQFSPRESEIKGKTVVYQLCQTYSNRCSIDYVTNRTSIESIERYHCLRKANAKRTLRTAQHSCDRTVLKHISDILIFDSVAV